MIYQHPLAYLLGLEGLALLRAWGGDFDREFVLERLAEVRRLLDTPALADHPGVDVLRGDTVTAYGQWAGGYDEPRNSLFDVDEPVIDEILDGIPAGDGLDAACGTGRLAARLAARGHRVIGVDSSTDMVEVARRRLPDADFRVGELEALPIEDASVDVVVCGLALSHARHLGPVFAEFARVLRPGGHVVISDTHHELVLRGSIVKALGPDGEPGLAATFRHRTGDHLRAALAAGLEVRRCEEPGLTQRDDVRSSTGALPPAQREIGGWADWPWSLLAVIPAAARAAWAVPPLVIWHFRRADG